jgi:hypothetical protein
MGKLKGRRKYIQRPPGLKIDLESKHYSAPVLRNLAAVHVAVESKT